jgi:hypothetical protein
MFIAELFTIAKIWNQPRCLSTDGWIKKMWHIQQKMDGTKRHLLSKISR